jgi:deazaflavin-dependent oxidoreductase (nitroreductase family)
MPLPYADPHRPTSAVVRVVTKVFRTPFGQSFIRQVAAKSDPWLSRVSNGRLSWSMGLIPTATLATTGAKSGQRREVQLGYFHDGADPIIIASHYGGPSDPMWVHNLHAHPDCEFGGDRFRAAEVTDAAEHARLYALAEQTYAGYSDYKVKTAAIGRHIPIFRLTPRDG